MAPDGQFAGSTPSTRAIKLRVLPSSLREANAFVKAHHRKLPEVRGCKFCLAAFEGDRLVGVAIVGRTKSAALQARTSAEITRLATDGTRNACSALYGACRRSWAAMGGDALQLYTYIEEDELGTSLAAAGYQLDAVLPARGGWNCIVRSRDNVSNPGRKRYTAA